MLRNWPAEGPIHEPGIWVGSSDWGESSDSGFDSKRMLIEIIAKDAKLKKAEAERALDSFLTNVTMALKRGERVTLTGFGTFSVVKRKARKSRHPQTGEVIRTQPSKVVRFQAGKNLRDNI